MFAGQGANGAPFVDGPGGVQFQGVKGAVLTGGDEPLPLSVDGSGAWLQSASGNGVFVTQANSGTTGSWIDAGRVTDPSAVTGHGYTVSFDTNTTPSTYIVTDNTTGTTASTGNFQSGQAINVDGMAFTISGKPAAGDSFDLTPSAPTLSVFDTLDKAIADLKTPNRSASQIAQSTQTSLRDIDGAMGGLQSMRSAVGQALTLNDGVSGRLSASELAAKTAKSDAVDLDMTQAISDFQNQQNGYDAALKTYSIVQRMSLFQYLGG